MTMMVSKRARSCAGAFLLLAAAALAFPSPASAAERVRFALERESEACPSATGDAVWGLAAVPGAVAGAPSGRDVSGCVLRLRLEGLTDADLAGATARLATASSSPALILELPRAELDRTMYAVKLLSSTFRGASPAGLVGLDSRAELPEPQAEELAPYVDALVRAPGDSLPEESSRLWLLAVPAASASPVTTALSALAKSPRATLVAVPRGDYGPAEAGAVSLARLQRYFTTDVSPDPTQTSATRPDGSSVPLVRYFDAKAFTPILLLPRDSAGEARITLSGGPFSKATVENLVSGVKRDFELKGAPALTLDLSRGALAVVLTPAERPGGATKAAVDVGAVRGLTADEIIARERAWEASQRERFRTYTALMDTSLIFRVAEFQNSIDLTIRGPFFWERGKPSDWRWDEFFLNGVRWKGRTIPKLPILEPDKVTTLPLEIRLTEEYVYELAGETEIEGRPAYAVDFRPRGEVLDKPIYRGRAWIDRQTFALLQRESIQMNLKGDTLSNVQTEYYRTVPGAPEIALPLEIKANQVFSTAGRTTMVTRYIKLTEVQLDPPDFQTRLDEAYASDGQMVRDTDSGLRYLIRDPDAPNERVVEDKLTRRSLFGLAGAFYQRSSDYPVPLLGVQYFDFDMWGKNKQLSVFFAGALLFGNYTDPSFLGSRFDLGADIFAVAFPFTEQNYVNGVEVPEESIKHLPALFQVNLGRPLGTYLKASLGLSANWDNYQRDDDTGPLFVTPVDTWTLGAELRLTWNQNGYNLAVKNGYFSRVNWEPWGNPLTSGYNPDQKDYWRLSVDLRKTFHFANFKRLAVAMTYLNGAHLDRFSQWDFGPFGQSRLYGFPGGSVRAESAGLLNLSYGLNIENVIRFEVGYDQALVTNAPQGYKNTYFSGVGVATSFNGPWDSTRIRVETGYPVIANGVQGFTINAQFLKVF
jgi:hypothetical protein